MQTDLISIEYTIEFQSPFHCGTGLRRGLVHRSVARDSDGLLFVPGSTIKGIAREKCEEIAGLFDLGCREPHDAAARVDEFSTGPGIVEDIFGSRSKAGSMFFDDAYLTEEYKRLFGSEPADMDDRGLASSRYLEFQLAPRTRVQLSRLTGAQKKGHLFEQDYGLAGLRFQGRVYGALSGVPVEDEQVGEDTAVLLKPGTAIDDDNDVEGESRLAEDEEEQRRKTLTYPVIILVASLLAIDAIGGGRSCGTGKCRIGFKTVRVNETDWATARVLGRLADLEYYEVAKL